MKVLHYKLFVRGFHQWRGFPHKRRVIWKEFPCHDLVMVFIKEITMYGSLPWPWFNIKMSSYQYRKSHCGDKTVVRSSYLHNRSSYTGKTTSLYWIRALVPIIPPLHTKNVAHMLFSQNPSISHCQLYDVFNKASVLNESCMFGCITDQ